MKYSFSDFLIAKKELINCGEKTPTTSVSYVSKKYVKIPLLHEGSEQQIPIKPKDLIKVLWEFDENGNVTNCKTITINLVEYCTNKTPEQIKGWLATNTILTKDNWFI